MKYFSQKGFTLIEIVLVVAIIAILASIVLPRFSDIRSEQVLKAAVEDVMSALDRARSQTLASLESSVYGVHFETDSITIFKGDTYSAGAADNNVIDIVTPASISFINLTGGTTSIYFERLSADPNVTGSVTVTNGTTSKVVSVTATGAVSVN